MPHTHEPHPSRSEGEREARSAAGGERAEDPSLARVSAFSDGVFAFAITLLVITIRIPHPTDPDASAGLLALLSQQWKSGLAYVVSFMFVGINWANHRVMFTKFARVDHTLIWLNLLYLMSVAFIPIPTAVLGEWIGSRGNEVVATVFYGASIFVGGILYNSLWLYGAYSAKLTHAGLTAQERRSHTLAWGLAPVVAAALTALSFVNPALSVAGYIAIIMIYVLPVPGMVALAHSRRRAPTPP